MAVKKQRYSLFLMLGTIFILTIGSVLYIVQRQTNEIVSYLIENWVYTANQSFVNYLTELEERVALRAEVISVNESVITAIKNGDEETLERYLRNLAVGMDFSTICNSNGIVLARSQADAKGDDVSGYKAVAAALNNGVLSTSIEQIEIYNNHLSVYASAPIFDNEEIIGVVSTIFDLTMDKYVDDFKEKTHCEATIFLYDERINTTITDENGNRITGTKAYDFVTDAVIGRRMDYSGQLELQGRMYGVSYSPLIVDDAAIGMLFTGVDLTLTLNRQKSMNLWIIIASFTGVLASLAFILFSGRSLGRYASLTEQQLNQQILMADISRSFLTDVNVDVLISKTLQMVGEFMNIPQVLIFRLMDDGFTFMCCNEWVNPKLGLGSCIGKEMPIKEPILSTIKSFAPDSETGSYLSSNDPVNKKAMSPYRVNFKNYITTPIFINRELIGVIDYSREENNKIWSDGDISLAALFASTLSGVFERESIVSDLIETRAQEAKLIMEKDNAERANRAKSDFLSNMSHEMRTPMNAIIGMTAIAKKAENEERKSYALERVEESAKHLLRIINDILDMSKIEANKFEITNIEFELKNLLQKTISFSHLDTRKQTLRLKVDDNVPSHFFGDDQRLTQVMTNLLSNASKFTPEEGKISIEISLLSEEDNVCELQFKVTDSGIGIAPEHLDKVFNVFEQAESGTTRKYGGTGLGLPISKRIVELMGGQMNVYSELGKGSQFVFTVKILRIIKDTSLSDGEADDSSGLIEYEFDGKKILLAEDIEINREIFISLLEKSGLTIEVAENGREAMQKILADYDTFDMVFMDVQMPEMDGLETTRRIRKYEKEQQKHTSEKTLEFAKQTPNDNRNLQKQIPIIAMTANVFKDDIENCIAAGMDNHIGKPLDMDRVMEILREYLLKP